VCRKKAIIAAGLLVVFALAACGGTDNAVNSSVTSPQSSSGMVDQSPTPSPAFILPIAGPANASAAEIDIPIKVAAVDVRRPDAQPDAAPPTTPADRSAFVVPVEAPAPIPKASPGEAAPAEAPPSAPSPSRWAEGCLDTTPVADVTIPDGSSISAGETFTKIWRLRNSGSCEWNDALGELQWAFVGGERMNGPDLAPIAGPVPAGSETDVQIELTAPTAPGLHEGRWQARGPDGVPVGVVFWVLIEVPDGGAAAPQATSDTSSIPGTGGAQPAEGVDLGQEVWRLVNGERDRQNLYQLAYNLKLAAAAQKHAEDCSLRGECSHTGSDGSDEAIRVVREGYAGSVDESWVWSASPADAVGWWLDEVPPEDWHRRMLLSDYLREVGVGVAPAPTGGHFFVAVFGIPGH